MRNLSLALITLFVAAGCYTYHDRYRSVAVEPEFWGTVTYVDPGSSRIDLDYVGDGGRHYTRSVYYAPGTRWDGVRYSDVRAGDRIYVSGRNRRGRYEAESVRRY